MSAREKEISKVTIWGAVCNVALSVFKLIAGVWGHSAAMMADAVHSLSDLVSDVVVLFMVRISSKEKDESHDYGHGKFETLATVVVALLLAIVGAKLLSDGVTKINAAIHGASVAVPGLIALVAAVVSVIVKELLFQWTVSVGRSCDSPAVITNAWHHRTDALSSVGSAIGIGAAVAFGGKWAVLDPVVCCVISIFILYIAVKMALPALNELTEASLPVEVEREIMDIICSVPGAADVHALKTRKSGPGIIIESHLVVDPEMSVAEAHRITTEAESALRMRFGANTQISIHVEPHVDAE